MEACSDSSKYRYPCIVMKVMKVVPHLVWKVLAIYIPWMSSQNQCMHYKLHCWLTVEDMHLHIYISSGSHMTCLTWHAPRWAHHRTSSVTWVHYQWAWRSPLPSEAVMRPVGVVVYRYLPVVCRPVWVCMYILLSVPPRDKGQCMYIHCVMLCYINWYTIHNLMDRLYIHIMHLEM